jgi:hypothetical protein
LENTKWGETMEREELHRRIELLRERIEQGKFHVAPHLAEDFRKSLNKVRVAADGLVDPDTVDGQIRSTLNAVAFFAEREEWKEAVSLLDVQKAYFEGVEQAFGQLFEKMLEVKADPYRFAGWFVSDSSRRAEALKVVDEFVPNILEFWENISDPTWIHLEDSRQSKAVFTGELFPDGNSNIASSTGVYFDTTILPDPFVKISPVLQFMDEEKRCFEVIRLGLQVLQYKDLALFEDSVPIVAVLPDKQHFEESYQEFITYCSEMDTVAHAETIFGRAFADIDELKEFLGHYRDPESLVPALKNPKELVFSTEWEGDLAIQIQRYIDEQAYNLRVDKAGDAVFVHLFSRFAQANDAFQRSRSLRGTPVIRAETSWLWFNWMLRNNSNLTLDDELVNLHIARALNTIVPTEFSWFGNVPPDAVIEIRKAGALEEIRELLGLGVAELVQANPANFFRTGDQVFENFQRGLEDHQNRIKELRSKKWTFAGRDLGSFLVVGGIELTAAITGVPLFGAVAATAGMTGVIPTAKDLREKLAELRSRDSEIRNNGVGILFKHES